MQPSMAYASRPQSYRGADVEDVPHAVGQSPVVITRQLAHLQHISQQSVVRMLHGQLLYLFHVQHV
jgi:hypothetical protein